MKTTARIICPQEIATAPGVGQGGGSVEDNKCAANVFPLVGHSHPDELCIHIFPLAVLPSHLFKLYRITDEFRIQLGGHFWFDELISVDFPSSFVPHYGKAAHWQLDQVILVTFSNLNDSMMVINNLWCFSVRWYILVDICQFTVGTKLDDGLCWKLCCDEPSNTQKV